MNSLGTVPVGGHSPVRVMGIINASPESFYKKSVFTEKRAIAKTAKQMEEDGADFIDIGGMSTAPYLKTLVSENKEIERITNAVEAVQKVSRLPISIDTCRASVAEAALDLGVEIINDISGLKYDKDMPRILDEYRPSVVVCSYSKKLVTGNQIIQARNLLHESIAIAKKAHIINNKIVVDPAVGFFRRRATGRFFTKIDSDWLKRDVLVLQNLRLIKDGHPLLVSVSRKSFVGNLLNEPNPEKRLYGSLAAETICVLNGADIIRTHNVKATRDAIKIAQRLGNFRKGL
ncbi:MAG: dihydropteroate synthase [Thaumarchaeota archaeon 13_1_20CM_2_39_11]|nr:MAG: dihydropteroate synthase [Thaumarchaeota archaeon 13_1_20CM_2_39_11]